jgi:diacylglycerol kinase family enzyme
VTDFAEAGAAPVGALDAAPRFSVLVNADAGDVKRVGVAAFLRSLEQAFAACGIDARITAHRARRLPGAARRERDADPGRILVFAGGDGTVSRLLPLMVELGAPVGVLPLGTLNLLGRDLGFAGSAAEIVAQLCRSAPTPIDVARINDVPFHSNAGLGFFTRMAREREESRRRFPFSKALAMSVAAVRAMAFTRPISVELEVDGRRVVETVDAVLITNNHFDGSPWRRASLQDGLLEVHLLVGRGLMARLRAALAVWRGDWRALPELRSFTCRRVSLRRRFQSRSSVAIDGEIRRMRNPIEVTIHPGALAVMAPPVEEARR